MTHREHLHLLVDELPEAEPPTAERVLVGAADVVRLAGATPPEYRLRAGHFRVRFARDVGAATIVVLHVTHRREAYR